LNSTGRPLEVVAHKRNRYLETKLENNVYGLIMKFSLAISRVRWFSFVETNILMIISVLVLRVLELI
jgi:hypothetical protein